MMMGYHILTGFSTLQVRVGMSVGHAPSESQYTPDMRKSADKITDEDRQDAERRIRGAVAEESPDDSGGDDLTAAAAGMMINNDATVRL